MLSDPVAVKVMKAPNSDKAVNDPLVLTTSVPMYTPPVTRSASLFDPEALKQGIKPERLSLTPEDVRDGKVLDRALEEVDGAVALARAKGDAASAQQYCQLIVEGCEAVAAAAGNGLFGSGEKVSAAEKAALDRIRQHLGVSSTSV